MTRAQFESWGTAAFAGALCLYALAGGVSLLRLGVAEIHGGEALRPLVGDRFVGAAALLDHIDAGVSSPPDERARDIETLLARAPLNPGAWLDLAIARRAAGEDISRVAEALRFSLQTGPHEARLMVGRVTFALPFWSALPPDLQAQLVDDIAGVAPYLEIQEREQWAAMVRLQTLEVADAMCRQMRRREVNDVANYGC